jgi:hypothetical protein
MAAPWLSKAGNFCRLVTPRTLFVVNGAFPSDRSPAYASATREHARVIGEFVFGQQQCDSLSAISIHFPESFSSLVQVMLGTIRRSPT